MIITNMQYSSPVLLNKCLICESNTNYFFSKIYDFEIPNLSYKNFKADYYKCEFCGLVVSRTHQTMSNADFLGLNNYFHHFIENNETAMNQPPYAEQALVLSILNKANIVNLENTLDFSAGYGTLAKILQKYFNKKINLFDLYVTDTNSNLQYLSKDEFQKYDLVINSAMFEHVLNRKDLDKVNALVSHNGVLMLHTVICETIPEDPTWFYLNPIVHRAFHTNKSMSLLMKQWGYASSIYSPQAKSWFLFKNEFPLLANLKNLTDQINTELQTKWFIYKEGFVDYWKGF